MNSHQERIGTVGSAFPGHQMLKRLRDVMASGASPQAP